MHTVVCILLVSVNVARKCICYMGEAAEYHVNDVVLICRQCSNICHVLRVISHFMGMAVEESSFSFYG